MLGKDRLIAHLIGGVGIMFDIRRQRQAAIALDQRQTVVWKCSVWNGSTRAPTVTSNASASLRVVPTAGRLLARTCASAVRASSTRSISTSTLPPLALRPNN